MSPCSRITPEHRETSSLVSVAGYVKGIDIGADIVPWSDTCDGRPEYKVLQRVSAKLNFEIPDTCHVALV